MRRPDPPLSIVGAHPPAAVDHQDHALIALVLELAHDRLADPLRRSPVDVPHRVADAVLGQLLEVGAAAALLIGLDADFLQAPIAGQPGVARDLARNQGTRDAVGWAEPFPQLAQPPARSDAHVGGRERDFAPQRRHDAVGRLDAFAADHGHRDRQAVGLERRIGVVVEIAAPGPATAGVDLQVDLTPAANRKRRRQPSRHRDRRLPPRCARLRVVGRGGCDHRGE